MEMESCHCPLPCSDSNHSNAPSTLLMLPPPPPLTFSFLHPKPPGFYLLMGASDAVRVAQKSIASNVHRFQDFLHKLRSQNALLERALSFPSYLHNCCQPRIQRGELQSMLKLSNGNFAAILPGDALAGTVVANGILNFLNIYNTLLVVRLVLTWFPSAPPAIVSPLSTLCDPYLNIFRGIIPPLGGTLDLSPILAFLVLNAFTSTASALPAELPPSKDGNAIPLHTTSSQKKWLARLAHSKSEKPTAGI